MGAHGISAYLTYSLSRRLGLASQSRTGMLTESLQCIRQFSVTEGIAIQLGKTAEDSFQSFRLFRLCHRPTAKDACYDEAPHVAAVLKCCSQQYQAANWTLVTS